MSQMRLHRPLCNAVVTLIMCLAGPGSWGDIGFERQIDQPASAVVKLFGAGLGNLDSYGSGTLVSAEGHQTA